MDTPYTPLLYSKIEGNRGIHYLFYFCSKTLIVGAHGNRLIERTSFPKSGEYAFSEEKLVELSFNDKN